MFCCLSGSPSSTRHKYHDDRCSPSTLSGSSMLEYRWHVPQPWPWVSSSYYTTRVQLPSPRRLGFVKYLSETNAYHYFHYDPPENVYFPQRTWSVPKCTFRRYNRRDDARERMIVMYELLMFEPCPNCRLRVPCFHAAVPWEPGNREHPTISCVFHTSAQFSFAPVSPWAIGTDMLPWHHFRYRCRGTLFRSTTVTNAS